MREFIPIILGADENAYACARQFYEINGKRSLVFSAKALPQTSYSKILLRYVIEELDSEEIFLAVMKTALPKLKKIYKKILLVPCSDYYAALVIRNREYLERYVDSPILNQDVYNKFKDKIAFWKLCGEMGIPHPKTEIILPSQIISSREERKFPLVMKPANSNESEYLHTEKERKKVYFCESAEALEQNARALLLTGYSKPVVLQEYIEGGAKSSRVINAYCDKSSKVRVIGVGEPLIEYSGDKLIGNYAAIRSVEDRRLCDAVADFLYRIGYVGFANIDIKIDTRTDCYYFLELNPRQGRSSYFMRVAGINLMRALYEDTVLGARYSGVHYSNGEGVWVNEPIGVIKREMKRSGLNPSEELLLGRTALDITYDFSIPRAAMLIKRKIGSYFRPI